MAIKPFAQTLAMMTGDPATDAAKALAEVLLAVTETGKAGKVTLVIDVKPVAKMQGAVAMTADVKATVPSTKFDSVFFVTPEGNASTKHPKQEELGLRDANAPAGKEPVAA